jgi:hypothetical protein
MFGGTVYFLGGKFSQNDAQGNTQQIIQQQNTRSRRTG